MTQPSTLRSASYTYSGSHAIVQLTCSASDANDSVRSFMEELHFPMGIGHLQTQLFVCGNTRNPYACEYLRVR